MGENGNKKETRVSPGRSIVEVKESGDVLLDPGDPFESAIIEMVRVNRAKRKDYALDKDMFSNFDSAASLIGIPNFGVAESILHLVGIKIARLHALRANGRMDNPENESIYDTYLDLAVYIAILFAWVKTGVGAPYEIRNS
jgi:hypothetical protein